MHRTAVGVKSGFSRVRAAGAGRSQACLTTERRLGLCCCLCCFEVSVFVFCFGSVCMYSSGMCYSRVCTYMYAHVETKGLHLGSSFDLLIP